MREATDALGLPAIELSDYEADDIIATYAKQAQAQGIDVTIVSSDKDLMQLIGDGIHMYDAMKQKQIGEAEVKEKFGVTPDKVLDVLSLIGDSSDNVPGVPGIGPKTAAELINHFGDLDTLLARAGEIKQPKRREALIENAEKARLSKELITLKYDVPLPPLSELALKEPAPEKLIAFVQAHGFKSLVARLQQKFGLPGTRWDLQRSFLPPLAHKNYTIVRDETARRMDRQSAKKGAVAFDTETTGLNPMQAELVGFSLCVEAGEACYVPLTSHRDRGSCRTDIATRRFISVSLPCAT